MMYLIDLPSLSSLNLVTHSGATVTLVVEAVVLADQAELIYSCDFLVYAQVQEWGGVPGFTLCKG